MNPTFGNYKLQNQATDFNAEKQFKSSLMEVLGHSEEKEPSQNSQRLYTMQRQTQGPPAEYLNRKRGSVFQKTVDV